MHRHCRGRLGKRVCSIGVWAVAWWWIVCSAGEIARSAVADDQDHEHMHGAVEAMTPHHPHTGPHMNGQRCGRWAPAIPNRPTASCRLSGRR